MFKDKTVSQLVTKEARGKESPIGLKKIFHFEVTKWILSLVIPVVVILLLNAYVCKIAIVQGISMYPSLYNKDLLIVRKIAYTPADGDIVLVNTKNNPKALGEDYVVKRIIAIGGQRIQIDYNLNEVIVDGIVLKESYISDSDNDPLRKIGNSEEISNGIVVPEGYVFIMGDNRNNSLDSRSIGFIKVDDIIGKIDFDLQIGKWASLN